ncbi:hypothetical protein D3C86_2111300 [compost metagenome]
MLAKNLFHFVETAEAKRVGKADQGRRRDAGLCGDGGDGIESNAVTVIQNVTRHLFQTLAQRFITVADLVL